MLYTILQGFLLLEFVWEMLTYKTPGYTAPVWVWALRITAAFAGIILGKLWQDRGFRLLAVLLLFQFFRLFLSEPARLYENSVSQYLMGGLWAFGGCYALGRVLTRDQAKRFLLIVTAVWLVWMLAYCGIGIYTAVTRNRVNNLAGTGWRLTGATAALRLNMIYLATVSGAVAGLSALGALLAGVSVRNRAVKAVFFAAALVLLAALCLTDARSAQVVAAAGIGLLCGLLLYRRLTSRGTRGALWYSLLAVLLAAAAALLLLQQVTPMLNRLRAGGFPVSRALAEEADSIDSYDIAARGFGDDLLHGRGTVWKNVLLYLKNNPLLLLTGASVYVPMSGVIAQESMTFAAGHSHNLALQMLLESGIPGLLLAGGFVLYAAVRCLRVLRNGSSPLWLRVLPVLPAAALLGELVECFLWQNAYYSPILFWVITVLGVICAAGAPDGRPAEQTPQPAEEAP